jgi:hypothetical protein
MPVLLLLHLAIATSLFGVSFKKSNILLSKQITKQYVLDDMDTTFRIVQAPENTYGYEIVLGNKTLIRQLNIPGRAGTKGFKKRTDAEKIARLILVKLGKGIMPPTINEKDLIKLKINF